MVSLTGKVTLLYRYSAHSGIQSSGWRITKFRITSSLVGLASRRRPEGRHYVCLASRRRPEGRHYGCLARLPTAVSHVLPSLPSRLLTAVLYVVPTFRSAILTSPTHLT